MNIFDKIKNFDNVLIISNQVVKEKLIDYFSNIMQLKKIIYKIPSEVSSDLLGKYDEIVRINLAKDLEESIEIADIKLENSLLLAVNQKSDNEKINELIEIRNKYKNYINKNELIENLYVDKHIILINNFNTSDEFRAALQILESINPNIKYLDTYEEKLDNLNVYEFANYKDELSYLLKKIAGLIEEGISEDRIKLHMPDNYLNYAKEIFNYANIALNLDVSNALINYEITKNILKELKEYQELKIEEAFKQVIKNIKNNPIIDKIIGVFNSYLKYDFILAEVYDDLVFKLKNTRYKEKYLGGIKVCNIHDEIIEDDEYVFILGFNQDEFPKTFKDEEYLLDYEREKFRLLLSKDKNQINVSKIVKIIKSIKNLYISYSSNLPLSSIASVERLGIDVNVVKVEDDFGVSYSEKLDKIALGKHLDLFYKYDIKSEILYTLFNMYPDNPYKKYDNKFTGVSKELLEMYYQNGITLSFTAIDKFYKCGFLFYLENVLKIRRNTNEESIFIGNLIHHLLYITLRSEKIDNLKDFLWRETYTYLKKEEEQITAKAEFFIGQYIDTLSILLDFIREQSENSEFKIFGLEKEFCLDLDFEVPVKLSGKIDKILKTNINNTKYAIVVDYKSGSTDFDLNRIVYGINMQIMFYFYFLNNYSDEKFEFAGGYLQGVMPNNTFLKDTKKTYLEQLYDYFKLDGYSSSNIEVLKKIDRDIEIESKFIKGIRFNKDLDFNANTLKRVLSKNQFEKLLEITKKNINEATRKILSGEFLINPKLIGKFDSCQYCSYKDICFRTNSNYLELKEFKGFEFLEENDDSN